uniref:Uncharacterized protein n=1 Tax=Coccolithus braarudii TaxID=221442 RepID=A0A7S0L942_9EUKA|mmetsp:Transcript_27198/g.58580  ORF Transcript_27198/g.58580 Transcript_27198/m.58580 type:complete len:358 (+) Transcript_27198:42-1115(+)
MEAAANAPATEPGEALPQKGEGSLFAKRKRNKNVRSRGPATGECDDDAGPSGSAVQRTQKAAKPNPLVQGTVSEGKRQQGQLVREFAQESDRRISAFDNKVFATNEQDVSRDRDAQAQYEEAQRQWAEGADVDAHGNRIYKGDKAYHQYTDKAESFTSQMLKGHGPARAPIHYRATSRFDYQPDVCKDFKDTGYCGYGDACKFLHDRSDYKSGWQIEKDWEESERKRKHDEALAAFEDAPKPTKEEDSLPFACLICRERWHAASKPVVTKCEHYFCEECALKNFQKSRRCFVCGEQTGGIFNQSKAIQEKINARMADEAAAVGEDDDELSHERLVAEYEAARKKSAARGSSSGWSFV